MSIAQPSYDFQSSFKSSHQQIVIVGNGPVGTKCAQQILDKSPHTKLCIFGDEPHSAYNRVQLSRYLAGDVSKEALANPLDSDKASNLRQLNGRRIVEINRSDCYVVDQYGHREPYQYLILATGSNPVRPDIPGSELDGVFCFRSLDHADCLIESRRNHHNVLVVGAGALGLETAVSLKTKHNHVYLSVRHKVLSAQLDALADRMLKQQVKSSGIQLIEGKDIILVNGTQSVQGAEFNDGTSVEVDIVIFCTGVAPNTQLAESAGLEVNKGVIVNDYMQTSDPLIYAIGECAEHNNITYGVVTPGFEQANTAAEHLFGQAAGYQGTTTHLQLKMDNHTTGVYGDIDPKNASVCQYSQRAKGVFRKLWLREQLIVGVLYIGDWPEINRIESHIRKQQKISSRCLNKFQETGFLWHKSIPITIKEQPEDYLVCLCQSVTRGEISDAIAQGFRNLDRLCQHTNAGVTCGSCRPMVAELLDQPIDNLVMRHYRAVYGWSIIALILIVAIVFNQPISASISVQADWQIQQLWFDNGWKQVSGYTLLSLCALAGALSARKRIRSISIGNLDNWRLFHSIVGVVALLVLIIHTGFRLGDNLNFALMVVFLLATTTGSLVGVFMSRNRQWPDLKLQKHRQWWSRVHYTLLWLLPALLAFHILAVYYY